MKLILFGLACAALAQTPAVESIRVMGGGLPCAAFGGRTEIIRDPHDLNPSTAAIADELSKQYTLGYQSPGKKDGRWHSIRVEIRQSSAYHVRARKGYVAN